MNFEYETNRLTLRILHPNNASMILEFYENNKNFLEPYEPARQPNFYTLDFQRTNLSHEYSSFLNSSYLRIWIFEKGNPDKPIGTVCFSNFLHGAFCSCMLGYKMDQSYTQKGYMTEALSFLLPLVCREYHFHRVEAYVMPANFPSIALLEKLSFSLEGVLKKFARIQGTWQDHYLYTYLAE